jgi:osmotically-inducible protein OsmY
VPAFPAGTLVAEALREGDRVRSLSYRAVPVLLAAAFLLLARPALGLWPEAGEPPIAEPTRPAWNVAERVSLRLAQSRALAGSRIRAEGEDANVALRGAVRDASQRQRALALAAQTPGVGSVRDELAVDSALPAPVPVPDEQLARRVAEVLAGSEELNARVAEGWLFGWRIEGKDWSIEVEVDDGDVLLEGSAPLQQHIQSFVLGARDVPGVRSVRSEITLQPNPAPADPVHSP